MNKNIIIMAALALAGMAVQAQSGPFEIKGTLKGNHNGYVYLMYSTEGRSQKMDSSLVKNGQFSFSGELPNPVSATVLLEKVRSWTGKEDMARLFIEPGKMQLAITKGSLKAASLTGSVSQKENAELESIVEGTRKKMKSFSEAYDKANEAYIAARKAGKDEAALEKLKEKATEAKDKLDPFYEEMRSNTIHWMKQHPASWVTASNMRWYVSSMKLQESEEMYAKMPEAIRQSTIGQELKKEIDGLRMGSPGSKAHLFTKKDINGQELSLADFKGKYVLVDFWASWCVPCRKGNPHLLSLYAKYKDKGFEIIGISDDDSNHEAWKKAVEKDGIGVWKHVLRGLDMKKKMAGEENPEDVSDYYGIHSLPTKILIDPNGVIVGRYGGGGENDEAMDKKLKEIFGS
ncbi:TlpA disulfide reductase family protein [Pseudoflavitalea rhizosphaerae]|uniref:TlpA disulfide reductase family protein n=1 Tax=Pseudoflavitalea rhizosphaerae TaxID=1884793 RepID=UPI0019D02B5B|nr:TlpA disulfide reductase family protein [Pseudoflavitalea rhizosphaerae]